MQNHALSHSTPLKNKNISSSIPRLTSSTEKTSSLTMKEQNIYNRHLQEEIIEIKNMFSNTINEVNNLKKEILLLKEENTNMKDVIDGTQKRNNETLRTNIRNDLDDHVRKIRDTRNEGRQKMCRLEDEIKKVDKRIMELIRDNLTQSNTNLLTKENNNTRVSNIGDKSLGADEGKKQMEKNIINSKRDRLKLLIIGDSIVRFIDAKKITNHRNSETISISGGKIENIPERINELASKYDIENIIFHIGTNHIPRENPDDVTLKLINLLEETQRKLPNTQLHFSAILPKFKKIFFEGINYINRRIFDFANYRNIKFIQHNLFAMNHEINRELFKKDNIHPSRAGSTQFARDIVNVFKGKGNLIQLFFFNPTVSLSHFI